MRLVEGASSDSIPARRRWGRTGGADIKGEGIVNYITSSVSQVAVTENAS